LDPSLTFLLLFVRRFPHSLEDFALMASFNLTVEDSSPLISYSPAGSWNDTPSGDPLASSYSGGSYHTTSTNGATATITFTGTAFSVYGGRRPNYGTYSVTVDGRPITSSTAQSNDASARQLLATAVGLPYGPHTAVLTSTSGVIDIDSIDFVGQVGKPGETEVRQIFDDMDSAIVYSPASAWNTNTGSPFMNGTLHFTNATSASATLSFFGEAVAVFGTVSPDHANFSVTIDGKSQVLPGGSGGLTTSLHQQVLLYYGSDLGSGEHTLTFSGDSQTSAAPFIDLDAITVFSTVGSPTSTPAAFSTSTATGSSSRAGSGSLSTPILVGSIFGGVIGLLAIMGIVFLLCMRRRHRDSIINFEKTLHPVSPLVNPGKVEAGLSIREGQSFVFPPRARQEMPIPTFQAVSPSSASILPLQMPPDPPHLEPLRHSIAPSYYGSYMSHSRDGSTFSSQSTRPLISTVPRQEAPNPRSTRRPAPTNSGMNAPTRPSKRPPTMDFAGVMSPMD